MLTMQDREARYAAEAVFRSWAKGDMPAEELESHVGAFEDPDLVGDRLLRALGLDEIELDVPVDDQATAWRWANTSYDWMLMSQDEDLAAAYLSLAVLVRAAISPACVKRDFCRDVAIDQMRKRVND